MTQTILLALSTLSSITGIATRPAMETTNKDLKNIAEAIDCGFMENAKGVAMLPDYVILSDLYNFEGTNRFVEARTDNVYVIYDKETQTIVEKGNTSPYAGFDDYFKLYYADNSKPGYLYFDGDDFSVIGQKNTSYTYNYVSTVPTNAKLISNAFYFQKLGAKYHDNIDGTCTIVALEMMLGYYDAFYNDKLVDEQYDNIAKSYTSSKSLKDFSEMPGTGSFSTGGDAFAKTLFKISKDVNGHEPAGGLSTKEQIAVAKKYLNSTGVDYNWRCSEGNWADRIGNYQKEVIKDAIDADRPVIGNGNGHSVVCYGYDDDNVYINLGWGYTGTYSTPWSTFETTWIFDFRYDVGAIDFSPKTKYYSDNFYSRTLDAFVCPDGKIIDNHNFTAESFGFASQYYFYGKTLSFNLDENTQLVTERLRCGYIENESINLSARRENAGTAYLEMNMNTTIYALKFDAAYWSEKENFSASAKMVVQYFNTDSNSWEDYYNLKNISKDRTQKTHIEFKLPENVSKVRFFVSDLATGTSNKGRIAFNNIDISYIA